MAVAGQFSVAADRPDRLLVRWLGGVVKRSDIRALKPYLPWWS
jgi:hypothetical protein